MTVYIRGRELINGVLAHQECKSHPISDQNILSKRMLRVLLLCELLCTPVLFHSCKQFLFPSSVFGQVHSKRMICRETIPWTSSFLCTAAKTLFFRSNQPLLLRLFQQDIQVCILPFQLSYGTRR